MVLRHFLKKERAKGAYINGVRFKRGRGSKMSSNNRIIEGKNRVKGGGGVKKDPTKSDIIYA